ncbi:MAG: nucleoside kinase [Oscillospiraceae bacterium]|nr:nucleoside kinase [Oscillospiraceae bacterium]
MAYQIQEINRLLQEDAPAMIAQCESAYHAQVTHAVDAIVANLPLSPIVLLSGPSGSGKTTTALKIEQALHARGIIAHTVSLDNYFLSLDEAQAPRTPEGMIDYESPLLLDMELLNETFHKLAAGEEVTIPRFDFASQQRNPAKSRQLRLGENEVAIYEGIHALNDDIAGRNHAAMTLYISAHSDIYSGSTCLFKGTWMRITRRAVRDVNFRGTDPSKTFHMWYNVRRGEQRYISPYRDRANIAIDSTLAYEVSLFANYAESLRKAADQLTPDNPRYAELHQLMNAFSQFPPIDEALVPGDSMLREFIGGGTYKYK